MRKAGFNAGLEGLTKRCRVQTLVVLAQSLCLLQFPYIVRQSEAMMCEASDIGILLRNDAGHHECSKST